MTPPRPSAVQLYAPDHPLLAVKVQARLTEYRQQLLEQLVSAQDWGDFKQRVGVILGIQHAREICVDIEKELQER